jgi:molybdopterin-guanine dinucleotide biosynthesis protein A
VCTHESLTIQVNQQIAHLENLNLEVVVILGGAHSELLLREVRALERCEMVFDTHPENELTFMTNLQAGMHCTTDATLVLKAQDPLFERELLQELLKCYHQQGPRTAHHVLRLGRGPWLVTRAGNVFFREAARVEQDLSVCNLASRVNTL